jgi:hypothetical protein
MAMGSEGGGGLTLDPNIRLQFPDRGYIGGRTVLGIPGYTMTPVAGGVGDSLVDYVLAGGTAGEWINQTLNPQTEYQDGINQSIINNASPSSVFQGGINQTIIENSLPSSMNAIRDILNQQYARGIGQSTEVTTPAGGGGSLPPPPVMDANRGTSGVPGPNRQTVPSGTAPPVPPVNPDDLPTTIPGAGGVIYEFPQQAETPDPLGTPQQPQQPQQGGNAMSWITDNWQNLLGAGLQIWGATRATDRATDAIQDTSEANINFLREMYEQGRSDQEPWRDVGGASLNAWARAMGLDQSEAAPIHTAGDGRYGGFEAAPQYQWRLDQGMNDLNRRHAAGPSGYLSGARMEAGQDYAQRFASNEFGNYLGRLQSGAGLGQTAAQQGASQANQLGQTVAAQNSNAGNARASGYLGLANTGVNAINNLLGYRT